jgi:hypothetical protein
MINSDLMIQVIVTGIFIALVYVFFELKKRYLDKFQKDE